MTGLSMLLAYAAKCRGAKDTDNSEYHSRHREVIRRGGALPAKQIIERINVKVGRISDLFSGG